MVRESNQAHDTGVARSSRGTVTAGNARGAVTASDSRVTSAAGSSHLGSTGAAGSTRVIGSSRGTVTAGNARGTVTASDSRVTAGSHLDGTGVAGTGAARSSHLGANSAVRSLLGADAVRQKGAHVSVPSAEEVATERNRIKHRQRFLRVLVNTLGVLVVVAAVAVLLVTLFLPVLQVTGSSMEPTLEDGDVIVLVKTSDFATGDLCAVRVSGNVLLKRMIAGPGDWVNIDEEGNVYVNGELLDEPYITDKALGVTDITYPYQVPDSRIFVMGDHRSVSVDSRSSEVGCIPYEQVIGRVIVRVWPLTKLALVS